MSDGSRTLGRRLADNWWLLRACRDRHTWRMMKGGFREKPSAPGPLVPMNFRFLDGPVVVRQGTTDVPCIWELFRDNEYYPVNGRWTFRSVVDAGANVGTFMAYATSQARGSLERYIGIEPDRDAFAVLGEQAKSLKIDDRAMLLNAAIFSSDGTASFDVSGESWSHKISERGSVTVPTYTLNTILDKAGLGEVDLLKVDIEGAEKALLEAPAGWAKRTRHLVCELHGLDFEWFRSVVEPAGFVAYPAGKLFTGHPGAVRKDLA